MTPWHVASMCFHSWNEGPKPRDYPNWQLYLLVMKQTKESNKGRYIMDALWRTRQELRKLQSILLVFIYSYHGQVPEQERKREKQKQLWKSPKHAAFLRWFGERWLRLEILAACRASHGCCLFLLSCSHLHQQSPRTLNMRGQLLLANAWAVAITTIYGIKVFHSTPVSV